jgi:hypothetical protein
MPNQPMSARTLPRLALLLLLCACATAPIGDAPAQPELAALAAPYAADLRAAGVTRLVSRGSQAMVRLETRSGPVYVRYPPGAPSVAFAIDIDADRVRARSQSFDPARDQRALDALLPDAIRAATANDALVWIQRNPWN